MKVSVAQFRPSGDVYENISTMGNLVSQAVAEGAELVVFPEESMFALNRITGSLAEAVDDYWSTFVKELSLLAANAKVAIVAGGYESSGEERPYNTLVVLDDTGTVVNTYRKLHLFDAFSYRESDKIKPGNDDTVVFEYRGVKIGVMTCYDLRFPELARDLVNQGAELILVPSAWFAGDHKLFHWQTILAARAIENTCYVAAAGTRSSRTIGYSVILDPMGLDIAGLEDEEEGVATAEVDTKRVSEVRGFLPVLKNRRYSVEGPHWTAN